MTHFLEKDIRLSGGNGNTQDAIFFKMLHFIHVALFLFISILKWMYVQSSNFGFQYSLYALKHKQSTVPSSDLYEVYWGQNVTDGYLMSHLFLNRIIQLLLIILIYAVSYILGYMLQMQSFGICISNGFEVDHISCLVSVFRVYCFHYSLTAFIMIIITLTMQCRLVCMIYWSTW